MNTTRHPEGGARVEVMNDGVRLTVTEFGDQSAPRLLLILGGARRPRR